MPVRRPNPRDADAADVGVLLEVANPGNRPFHTSNLEMTADWNVISLSCPMTPIRESGAGLAQTRSTQSAFCGGGCTPEPCPVTGRCSPTRSTTNRLRSRPVPYVIAIVELAEQADLRTASNIVNCEPDSVYVGPPLEVRFERHDVGCSVTPVRNAVSAAAVRMPTATFLLMPARIAVDSRAKRDQTFVATPRLMVVRVVVVPNLESVAVVMMAARVPSGDRMMAVFAGWPVRVMVWPTGVPVSVSMTVT